MNDLKELRELIVNNIHNINGINGIRGLYNINNVNTHYFEYTNKFHNYSINDILLIMRSSLFDNVKVILREKKSKEVKSMVIKEKYKNDTKNTRYVCSCESTCRCTDKYYEEIITKTIYYEYFETDNINDYCINDNLNIFGFNFTIVIYTLEDLK